MDKSALVPLTDVTSHNPYLADPFDPDFFTKNNGNLEITALGACEQVYNWMVQEDAAVGDVLYGIKPTTLPPFSMIRLVLQRARPNDPKYKD